jgi:hypothetical protein
VVFDREYLGKEKVEARVVENVGFQHSMRRLEARVMKYAVFQHVVRQNVKLEFVWKFCPVMEGPFVL